MSRTRRILVATTISLVVVAFFAGMFRSKPEPKYKGRLLSAWLKDALAEANTQYPPVAGPKQAAAAEALRAAGDEAFPVLLRLITPGPPLIKSHLGRASFLNLQTNEVVGPKVRDYYRGLVEDIEAGELGFRLLGAAGKPAVPQLVGILRGSDDFASLTAANCLYHIGPPASAAVPALLEVARKKPESPTADSAMVTLREVGGDPQVLIPGLCAVLSSAQPNGHSHSVWTNACWLLARFGSQSVPAVPQLVPALTNHEEEVRWAASNALHSIAPRVLTNPKALKFDE